MVKGKPKVFKVNLFNGNHSPGSYIEGNVFLELSKDMVPMKAIKIQLSGTASVKWTEHRHGGGMGGSSSRTYGNSEHICGLTWIIWRNEGSYQQQAVSVGLSAGQYEFPFRIQILADLSLLTSFEGTNGFVRYSLIAGISRSQEERLEHTSIAVAIAVKDIVNINVPHLMQPISMVMRNTIQTFWRTCGSASLSVTLNKQGYCPGEYIAFSAKFENQSTKKIDAIYVSLVQTVKYCGVCSSFNFSLGCEKYKHVSGVIQRIEGSGVAAGKTGHWNNGLLLIPVTNPTTDERRPHIIQLSYAVIVTLVFHKARDACLHIPVTIGTTCIR